MEKVETLVWVVYIDEYFWLTVFSKEEDTWHSFKETLHYDDPVRLTEREVLVDYQVGLPLYLMGNVE